MGLWFHQGVKEHFLPTDVVYPTTEAMAMGKLHKDIGHLIVQSAEDPERSDSQVIKVRISKHVCLRAGLCIKFTQLLIVFKQCEIFLNDKIKYNTWCTGLALPAAVCFRGCHDEYGCSLYLSVVLLLYLNNTFLVRKIQKAFCKCIQAQYCIAI